MEREGGPDAAAFPPPAAPPFVFAPPAGARGILPASLQALLESLASSACGESASATRPSFSPLVVAARSGVLCSAVLLATTRNDSGSLLLVLAFFAALVGALAYLPLLAVGRTRR